MRRPTSFDRGRKPLSIEMAPMIDVVFLLLVYFLWTLSFAGMVSERVDVKSAQPETAGTVEDPNQTPPEEADFENVAVRIENESGKLVYVVKDAELQSLAELEAKLNEFAASRTDAPVIVDPAPEVLLGDAFDVYDLAKRRVGFEKVQFAADPGEAG
jgi:biopolymer transport protein ExbD